MGRWRWRRWWGPNLILAALLLAALLLRLYGIDWDAGHGFHPDERSFYLRADDMFRALAQAPGYESWLAQWPEMQPGLPDIATALSAERSPLNPHWFPLGSVLIYALVLIRAVAEPFADLGALDLRFAGRALAALADTASVGMMFVIGRRVYGQWTGLLAAALTAFAVIHIQHAHFYRPEPFTVLASLGALWAMLRLIETRRWRDALLLGIMVGLAMATKIAVAPILLPLLLTFLWLAKDRSGKGWRQLTPLALARVAPMALAAGAAALAAFLITTPYALLDWSTFLGDIREQTRMAREAGHFPFTWQYADTPAFWYQLRQTAVWGLGLPLGIAAWVAAPFTLWMAWRGGVAARADWLLLAWAAPAFVFLELFEVKFLRYVFPLLPFYILMAARMLMAAVAWADGRRLPSGRQVSRRAGRTAARRADNRLAISARRTMPAAGHPPGDAPFSEEWHATPPTVGDDAIFDEPLAGEGDAPFSEEWHATPPLAGTMRTAEQRRPAAGNRSGNRDTGRNRSRDGRRNRDAGRNRNRDGGRSSNRGNGRNRDGGRPAHWADIARGVRSITGRAAPRAYRWAYPAALALVGVVVGATVLYAIAFAGIYGRPHTAVAASEWINDNAPPDASIINAGSLWDERIPDLGRYDIWEFPAYHRPDDGDKVEELAERLAGGDYLVFYSNRAYGAVSRLPAEFPRSAAFYRLLFAGDLGYELERGFTSYPALAGVSLRDNPYGRAGLSPPAPAEGGSDGQPRGVVISLGYADENVVGYDHPQALVFRNTERLPAETLRRRIEIERATHPAPAAAPLMLSPAARQAQQSGGTWSQVFHRDGWGSRAPALAWLLAATLPGLLAFPFLWWLLRPLPDRGLLAARAGGLLLVALVAWLLVSAGVVSYSLGAIGLAMAAVALPSAIVLWRQGPELWQWLRRKWRLAVTAELLFLLAYVGFLLVRAANPDLWHPWRGGEKPMELAYFTAVARSSAMPPYDPWFSGGYLNYYYWGYFILSVPLRLTGIVPAIAFNLATPLLFAMTATGAGALAYNIVRIAQKGTAPKGMVSEPATSRQVASSREGEGDGGRDDGAAAAGGGRRPGAAQWRHWLPGGAGVAGVIAAGMATVAGNLDGAAQLFQMTLARAQGMAAALSDFDFWRSSRAIPVLDNFEPSRLTPWLERGGGVETGFHITEFPFFTFLFADLHAHMMTMPFALLGLTLGFALLAGTDATVGRNRRIWITAGLLGVTVGSLWAINSWEYPAYALLMAGIIAAAAWLMPGTGRVRLATGAGLTALALAASYGAFLPFHAATETFGTGLEATRWRTPLVNYLLIHALPLLAAALLLSAVLPAAVRPVHARIRRGTPLDPTAQWLLAGAALGVLLAIYCWAAGFATAGCLVVLLTLTLWSLGAALVAAPAYPARRSDVMALGMLALALGIGIGVDFLRIEGDIGRMNTVFKYYLVAWLLLAVAGGYGLWRGWTAVGSDAPLWRIQLRSATVTVVGLVAAAALVYPALATPVRIDDRFGETPLTLDGTAYMRDAEYHISEGWCGVEGDAPIALARDAGAIRWLQDNVRGTPVIVEAEGNQYCWNGRFSAYTGLPTALGWPWHQTQQRGDGALIRRRADDVARLYNTDDRGEAQDVLDKYGIAYIIVGDLERVFYDAAGIAKFEAMAAAGALDLVYDRDGALIYRVVAGGT